MITRRSLLIHASAVGAATAVLPASNFWAARAQASEWEKPGDMAIGAVDAPVTVIEYFSLTCPHCQAFHVDTYMPLKKAYIDTGKVRFVARDFPLNRPALHAAILARCAGPERYFAFIDTLFNTFDEWTRASDYLKALEQLGQLGGVSAEQFRACLDDEALEASVLGSIMEAQSEYDVGSTPTFVVNGKKYEGGMRFSRFSEVIDRLLPDG